VHGADAAAVEHETAELEFWVQEKFKGSLAGEEATA